MTVERYIRIMAGFFVMLSLALGIEGSPIFVSPWFLAFTAFVGFKMPAGKHRVRLVYRTPGLRSGLLISLLTALAILVYAAFSHKEWRREFRAKKKEK